jgi:hypothetical protein
VDHFLINLFPGKKIELFGIRIYHTTVKKSELQAKIGRKLKITKNNNWIYPRDHQWHQWEEHKKCVMTQDAFKYCGLNPWSTANSMKAFKNFLDTLESNNIVKAMILTNQKAVQSEWEVSCYFH